MEVEMFSTSMACPRGPKRTENLMLSQVRSARAGETSVTENRLKFLFKITFSRLKECQMILRLI